MKHWRQQEKEWGKWLSPALSCAAYLLLNSIIMKGKLSKGTGNTYKAVGNNVLQGWPSLDFVFCFWR